MDILSRFPGAERVLKGWSGDKKFRVTTREGRSLLLRISSGDKKEAKHLEFELMRRAWSAGCAMPEPVEFGECREGVYSLQEWLTGGDAEELVPTLAPGEQYALGLRAGENLKIIHSVPAPVGLPEWEEHFSRKIDRKIAMYEACPLKNDDGGAVLSFVREKRGLISRRPSVWQHGDFHIGNMMLTPEGIKIIDFDRSDFGDPWEEFNRIVWSAQASPDFASGTVDGYFGGEVPEAFWQLLALYIAVNTLSSLPWAIPYGEEQVRVMINQARQVLDWYDGMKNTVPKWYGESEE